MVKKWNLISITTCLVLKLKHHFVWGFTNVVWLLTFRPNLWISIKDFLIYFYKEGYVFKKKISLWQQLVSYTFNFWNTTNMHKGHAYKKINFLLLIIFVKRVQPNLLETKNNINLELENKPQTTPNKELRKY